jgi:autotransporter-associated beta strand protein
VNAGNHGWWGKYSFTNTANTFTGAITDSRPGNDGINNALLSFNSIADGAGYGNIILNGANDSGIDYGSGAIAPLNLNNRQIILANNNTVFFNNASSQAVNINTDIGFSGTGARQIRFGITGAANHTPGSGINTINGKLTDNAGGAFTPTFNGGTWVLAGTNTYSGVTTLSAGTLSINSLANVNGGASALGTPTTVVNGTLSLNGVTLQYTGSGHASDRVINLSCTTTGATLDASGAGALVLTSALTATGAGSKTLTLTGTSTATNTLGGAIVNSSSATSLTKSGTGTWVLAGSNTYSGATMITNGILMGVTGGACASSAVTVTNTPGNISALAIRVTNTSMPWSCANLAFTTNGVGSQLQFSFAVAPSTSLAPLSITNNLTFTGAPLVVVNTANLPAGIYPLLVVGGTAPTAIPALDLMGSTWKGSLAWSGTGNKTLYLTLVSKATIIRIF